MTDALRARQQRIVELHGVEMEIALDLLEPLGGVARRALQAQHLGAALILVAPEGRLQGGLAVQVLGKRDGAFQSELGAGAHGEVRGCGRVAHQHDVLV